MLGIRLAIRVNASACGTPAFVLRIVSWTGDNAETDQSKILRSSRDGMAALRCDVATAARLLRQTVTHLHGFALAGYPAVRITGEDTTRATARSDEISDVGSGRILLLGAWWLFDCRFEGTSEEASPQ